MQPDPRDPLSLLTGARSRVATKLQRPDPVIFQEFREFSGSFFRKHFTPLAPDTDIDTWNYLQNRPYSDKKKKQMWNDWTNAMGQMSPKDYEFGVFCKDETYVKFAHSRLINAPSDIAKLYFGPVIAKIEEQAYNLPWFIKKIPVANRPEYLKQKFAKFANPILTCSDFTSFECSFSSEIKDAIEFEFLKYMTSVLPEGEKYFEEFTAWTGGEAIKLKNKFFTIIMQDASRLSGELTTSLFNGLTNVLIHEFFAHKTKQQTEFSVEGDDNIAAWEKVAPTPEFYQSLGFDVKLEVHKELRTTSFCGQVFDPTDMAVLTDPRYVLAGVGWLPYKYVDSKDTTHLALLRAKAWSYGYQYQGCPIISSMANYLLRVTRSIDVRKAFPNYDSYKIEQLRQAIDAGNPAFYKEKRPELYKEVGPGSRVLMFELYGVSQETQIMYENYFDNCDVLQPIPDFFGDNVPSSWKYFDDTYVRDTSSLRSLMELPSETFHTPHPITSSRKVRARSKFMQTYVDKRVKFVPP